MGLLVSLSSMAWTVKFTNPDNWSDVAVWAWNGGTNYTGGKWPGARMEKEGNVWTYTGDGSPAEVIFNNNNNGSEYGGFPFVDGGIYSKDGIITGFAIHGEINGENKWTSVALTKNSDGDWEYTGKFVAGNFGIRVYNNNNIDSQVHWIPGGVTISSANTNYTVANSGNNSSSSLEGWYKIVYNPEKGTIKFVPVPVVKSYAIHGTLVGDTNWTSYPMTEKDGLWSVTLNVKSGTDFGINYYENNTKQGWYYSSSPDKNISAPGTYPAVKEGNGSGGNWRNMLAGEYTYTFNPATNLLTVSQKGQKVYGIRGYDNNDWNSNQFTFTGSPLTVVINNYQKPTYGFKVHDGTGFYGNTTDAKITRNGSITLVTGQGDGYNINLASSAVGKDVTLTLELNSSGVPSKLTASWAADPTIIGEWGGHTADWTGTGTACTSTEDGYYVFNITPTSDGDLKFRFKIDGNEYCPNSGSNTSVTNNVESASKAGSTGYFYIGGAKANKTYTIKYKISDGKVLATWVNTPVSTNDYYLAAGFLSNWTYRVKFTPSDEDANVLTAKATYHESNTGNKGFKITTKDQGSDDGTWYSTATTLSNGVTVNIANKTESGNMKLNSKAKGQEVLFTLTLGADGKPASLTATWQGTDSEVKIIGDFSGAGLDLNSWTASDGYNATPVGNEVYTYTFKPTKDGNIYFGYAEKETRYYPLWSKDCPATSDNTADASKAFNSQKEAGVRWVYNVTGGKFYVITVDLSAGDGVNTPRRVTISESMPVYPIGVYNEEGLSNYAKWPVLYVQSTVLNNNRITPEYQMNKISDTRYELEFTLRNTRTEGANWGANDYPLSIVGFENAHSATKTYINNKSVTLNKTQSSKEGARYKAVVEKVNGNWNLTLTPVGDEKNMPFLSMIGKEWKQRTTATTPFNNHKTGEGWQESWVQYDSRGQLLLDRSGNVMYNTTWPPRNTIFFKTAFEVNGVQKDFTIKSDQLTFSFVESKTGAEWKADERFAKYEKEGLNESEPSEHVGKLALDDNRTYSLYRAKNMWINGDVKLWTGWGGVYSKDSGANDNTALANWSWHTNWGHFGERDNAVGINPESSVQLSNRNGDVKFENPTFFQYVDFFYEETDPNAKGHSVLFTELSEGGAQIAAMSTKKEGNSTNDYEIGNFQASLNNLGGFADPGQVKKVTIRSYATNSNGDNVTEEMIKEVFSWPAAEDSPVMNKDFYTIFASRPGNSELPGDGGYTNDDKAHKSEAKWVKDTNNYSNGDYFYRMTVVLTDDNGAEHTVIVDSNPFTIFHTEETLTLNVYQLVKVDEEVENGVRVGRYYTYKGSEKDHTVPVLPAYELWIENDNKFDAESNKAYDNNGNLIGYIDDTQYKFTYRPLEELPEYGMSSEDVEADPNITKMQFTDKVLIVGGVPSANVVEGYAYGVGNKNEVPAENPEGETTQARVAGMKKAPMTEEYDRSCMREDNDNRFMHVTNVGTFEEREFTLAMQYSTSFLDYEGNLVTVEGATTAPVSADYTITVPEPKLKEAKVQVHYGDVNKEDSENDFGNFEYRGLPFSARYHSVRDYIEVEFPNVSHFMKERLIKNNFFTLKLTQKAEDNQEREWDNIFEFTSEGTADGVVVGPVLHPSAFNKVRTMTLVKNPAYKYYPRWKDGDITPIYVSDNAPIRMDHVVKNPSVYVDKNGHLISKFTIVVKHEDDYTPSRHDAEDLGDATNDKHNYVFHEGKDLFEHLQHHSDRDYYYVAIVDKTKGEEKVVDGQTAISFDKAVIDKYGNVTENADDMLHAVVPATNLMKTANGNGKEFVITKDYGLYTPELHQEAKNNHFSNQLYVLVSYLYPFANTQESSTPAAKAGMKRVAKDYSSNVLKSEANEGALTAPAPDVITGLEDIDAADYGKVYAGVGYIEVEGNNVEIYRADGAKVAVGEGRHEVSSGVYMVRLNGRVEKVYVR